MNVTIVPLVPQNLSNAQPIKKEFVHTNVMVFTEEDDAYVLLLPESKLVYSKKYYKVREEERQYNV